MLRRFLLALIRVYRAGISPWTPASCRFTPTCSAYAEEAIHRYGSGRGGWLALRRLLRCHPFGTAGYDPVPGAAGGEPAEAGRRPAGPEGTG